MKTFDQIYKEIVEAKQAIKWRVKPPAGTKNAHPDGKQPGKAKFSPALIKKAIAIANSSKYKDYYSGAYRAIEKLKPGLEDHPKVLAALKAANESAEEVDEFSLKLKAKKPKKKTIQKFNNSTAAAWKKKQDRKGVKTAAGKIVKKALNAANERNESIKEAFKVGDFVSVNTGPHKGEKHEIIHVKDDGGYNVKLAGRFGKKTKYKLGAASAKKSQVSAWKGK